MASSFLSNLGGAVASGATNLVLNNAFGKDIKPFAASVANKQPTTFNAGGLNFGFNGTRITGGSTAARQGLVGQNASFFSQQAGELGALKDQVTPGFGALTNARVQAIQNARRSAVGNLRDSLARRRVSGSSFGEDAIARTEAEFAQSEAEARATSFLQELDLKTQLIDRQFNASRGAVDAFLGEMNFQADIAKQLAQSSNAVLADNAKFAASLLSSQAASDNALLGNIGGSLGDVVGQGASSLLDGNSLSSLFSGGGTAANPTLASTAGGSGSLSGPSALSLGGASSGALSTGSAAAAGNSAAGLAGGPTGLGLPAAGGPGGGMGVASALGGAASTAVPAAFTAGEAATLAGTGSQFVSGGAIMGGSGASSSAAAGPGLAAFAGPALVAAVAAIAISSTRSAEAKEKSLMGENLIANADFTTLATSPNGVQGYAFRDAFSGETVYIHPDSIKDVVQGRLRRRIRLSDVGDGTPGLWDVKSGIIDRAKLDREKLFRERAKKSTGGSSTKTPINKQQEGAN